MPEPNHICKFSGCTLGEHGGPRQYYACNWCDRTASWRSAACCPEHYTLYMQEVALERGCANRLPLRTDMEEKELRTMLKQPLESVKEQTLEELADYAEIIAEGGIAAAVDYINGRKRD